MNILDKIDLDQVPNNLSKELKDINEYELYKKSLNDEIPLEEAEFIKAKIGTGVEFKVNLINDSNDIDGDIAKKLGFEAVIDQKAVLNYDINASINAEVGGENQYLSLGLKANQNIIFTNYSVHDKTNTLLDAITADASDLKIILLKEQVLKLSDKSAAGMVIDGSIGFEAEAKLSDAVSAGLSGITRLINASDVISLNIDSSISLKLSIKIDDMFEVLVQRNGAGFKASINKSIKRTIAGGIEAKVGVSIENPEVISDVVKKLFDNVEEGVYDKIEPLIKEGSSVIKSSQEKLENLIDVAEFLAINIPDNLDEQVIDKLKETIREKREELEKEIEQVIKSKVELSASYSYTHTKEAESLFTARFTESALIANFQEIIRLQNEKLVENALKPKSGISDITYSKLAKVDIKRGLKLGFSVGDIFSVSLTTEQVASNELREKWLNGKLYHKLEDLEISETRNGNDKDKNDRYSSTRVALGAGMSEYILKSERITPAQLDFDFSLSHAIRYKGKLKEYRLREMLDLGVCMGILDDDDREEQLRELNQTYNLSKSKKVGFNLGLKVPRGQFDLMIDEIARLNKPQLASIFAEALPYVYLDGRRTLNERIINYSGFFLKYLNEGFSHFPIKTTLRDYFNSIQKADLAHFESGEGNWGVYDADRAFTLTEHNDIGKTFGHSNFSGAFSHLLTGMNNDYKGVLFSKQFKKGIYRIKVGGGINLYDLRILSRLINHMAEANGITADLESTFEIQLPKKVNGADVILLK